MSNTSETLLIDAEQIAEMADRGENVTRFYAGKGKMRPPLNLHRVDLEFTVDFLLEIDRAAAELNISRDAAIKSLLRQSLDHHYLALAHTSR